MTVDLSALLRGEVRSINIDAEISPDSAPEGVTILPGSRLKGVIEDSGGYIRLTSEASVPYRGQCARCLDTVNGTLKFEFNRTLVTEGTVAEDVLEENAEEYLVIHKGFIDPDSTICESVFLEFPMVLLCRESCRGLCPKCGKKLPASGECGCAPAETDPRWNKLKEIFSKD